jgi:hypothetical protein
MFLAIRLGRGDRPGPFQMRARIAAHLAFASPPLFTLIGVLTYMGGWNNGDYWLWPLVWLALSAYVLLAPATGPSGAERLTPERLRSAHGFVAATVIVAFLGMHLANHLVGLWSAEAHIAVMKLLRKWYRHPVVETALVALMLFMVGSGLVLLRARLTRPAGVFETLHTMTGTYLLLFIPGHMNSVFMFQRLFMGKDTDFWFAAGGPGGLLGDPWSVRLIPHYALGVWSLVTHAAGGLRIVLISHGAPVRLAHGITAAASTAGAIGAIAMVLGLCRVHLA